MKTCKRPCRKQGLSSEAWRASDPPAGVCVLGQMSALQWGPSTVKLYLQGHPPVSHHTTQTPLPTCTHYCLKSPLVMGGGHLPPSPASGPFPGELLQKFPLPGASCAPKNTTRARGPSTVVLKGPWHSVSTGHW